MATIKQKKAIDNLVGNGGNVTQAMLDAGYTQATANTPQKLTDSIGFQELANKYLPDDMLLGALQDDIKSKPKRRTRELELAFKVKGRMNNVEPSDKEPPTPILLGIKIDVQGNVSTTKNIEPTK